MLTDHRSVRALGTKTAERLNLKNNWAEVHTIKNWVQRLWNRGSSVGQVLIGAWQLLDFLFYFFTLKLYKINNQQIEQFRSDQMISWYAHIYKKVTETSRNIAIVWSNAHFIYPGIRKLVIQSLVLCYLNCCPAKRKHWYNCKLLKTKPSVDFLHKSGLRWMIEFIYRQKTWLFHKHF